MRAFPIWKYIVMGSLDSLAGILMVRLKLLIEPKKQSFGSVRWISPFPTTLIDDALWDRLPVSYSLLHQLSLAYLG